MEGFPQVLSKYILVLVLQDAVWYIGTDCVTTLLRQGKNVVLTGPGVVRKSSRARAKASRFWPHALLLAVPCTIPLKYPSV